jgi:carboxymethylenebutenolidase
MDAFGIRPALGRMANRLAAQGYAVVGPNLYYRHGDYAAFDPAAVAPGGPEHQRFRGMIASINNAMVLQDTERVLAEMPSQPAVAPGPMAAVGYCMGGGFALSAAAAFPDRIVAAASFHGGSLATEKADSPHLRATEIKAKLYIGVAGLDPTFDAAQQARLRAALDAAGTSYTLEVYDGAKHGFAVEAHLAYERNASERHWDALTTLLRERLPATTG